MDEDLVYFDMDENMGSYYDFNLLDLIEEYDDLKVNANSDTKNLDEEVKNS